MAPPKRGLGWPWDNQENAFGPYHTAIEKHELTWLFNWEMWKPKGFPAALEYIPQVRTAAEAPKIDQFLKALGSGHVSHFLGFNEPDNSGQANLPAAKAAALWRQLVLPAKAKYKFRLGSPAITNAPAGKAWLQAFLKELGGHDGIDFVAVHWYGRDVHNLATFVDDIHATFKKPVWLTEFACTTFGGKEPAVAEVEKFAEAALRMLDGKAFVERHAWFGAATHQGSLGGVAPENVLVKDGKLTAVGKVYCGENSTSPHADPISAHPQIAIQSRAVATAATKPGVHLTNKSHKAQTYNFYNNLWNGNGKAGANFDHPEHATHLAPGATAFVALPTSFKGRVQRGTLIPATWVEFQVSAASDHKAWGDVSLEQGYDGPAMVRAADGSKLANGFTHEILAGAPAAARMKRADGVECIASTEGNWLGGRNQAAIDYEKKVVGQKKAYIEGGSGTDMDSSSLASSLSLQGSGHQRARASHIMIRWSRGPACARICQG